MPNGRPPKFKSTEDMQMLIDAYFLKCETDGEPITVTGLALALDTTRETLMDYENNDKFSDTVKRAKTKVQNYAERMLYLGKSAAGPIFALKNFGWSDKSEHELYGKDGGPIKSEATMKPEDKEIIERYLKGTK